MTKKEAMAVLNSKIVNGEVKVDKLLESKIAIEREIRKLSYADKGFENTVFELGCSVLAKKYVQTIVEAED